MLLCWESASGGPSKRWSAVSIVVASHRPAGCGTWGAPSRAAWSPLQHSCRLVRGALQVEQLLERGVYDMKELAEGGWLTALRYEDEVIADLKKRTGGKADKVRAVSSGSHR